MPSTRYVMLMASLPHLGDPFAAERPPINRVRLEQRLGWLEDEHRELATRIERVLQWERLPLRTTDEEILGEVRSLHDDLAEYPTLQRVVADRMELRTLVVALRRRNRGQPAPTGNTVWGFGRGVDAATRNYDQPGFRLDNVFPWVVDAERMLREEDVRGLERLLVRVAWGLLDRAAGHDHRFDLEAVVIYLLRWGLVDRCTRHSVAGARERFARMVDEALGDRAPRFEHQEISR